MDSLETRVTTLVQALNGKVLSINVPMSYDMNSAKILLGSYYVTQRDNLDSGACIEVEIGGLTMDLWVLTDTDHVPTPDVFSNFINNLSNIHDEDLHMFDVKDDKPKAKKKRSKKGDVDADPV